MNTVSNQPTRKREKLEKTPNGANQGYLIPFLIIMNEEAKDLQVERGCFQGLCLHLPDYSLAQSCQPTEQCPEREGFMRGGVSHSDHGSRSRTATPSAVLPTTT